MKAIWKFSAFRAQINSGKINQVGDFPSLVEASIWLNSRIEQAGKDSVQSATIKLIRIQKNGEN